MCYCPISALDQFINRLVKPDYFNAKAGYLVYKADDWFINWQLRV